MAKPQFWQQWSSDSSSQAAAAKFAEAWQSVAGTDNPPDIDRFAPAATDPRRGPALQQLIALDLESRWRRGQSMFVEHYLERYPEIRNQSTVMTALLYTELQCRQAYGDKPSLMSYEVRFPTFYPLLESLSQQSLPGDFATLTSVPRGDTRPDLIPIDGIIVDSAPDSVSQPPASKQDLGSASTPPPQLTQLSNGVGQPQKHPPGPERAPADAVSSSSSPSTPSSWSSAKPGSGGEAALSPLASGFAELIREIGYKLISYLGRGQFGEVWRAEAPGGIATAIKIITRTLDDATSQRELQALEIIRNLHHPYLLSTHAYWSLQDHLVIAMQLADSSLSDYLKQCKKAGLVGIPVKELLGFFRCAADGLDFLHRNKVQHRDVKPDNLLLLKGIVQVADFGLVRLQEDGSTATATFCGTPAFMAPEMWHNRATLQSDQYSLAVSYVKLRTGDLPFASKSMMELMLDVCSKEPNLDKFDGAERNVLKRALAKAPEQRYASCREFVDALVEAVEPKADGEDGRRSGRMPRRYFLAAAGLAAVSAASAWLFREYRSPVEPPPALPPHAPGPACAKGCQPVGLETVKDSHGKEYYKLVQRELNGAAPLTFVPIIPNGDGQKPFYILATKVTVGQFKAFLRGHPNVKSVQDPKQEDELHPALNLGDGKQDDLPILNVRVQDAYAFAHSIDGTLPTVSQWNEAAGKAEKDNDFPEGPYRGRWNTERKEKQEFYLRQVGRVWKTRPMFGKEPDWTTPDDVSRYRVHHMAANGLEWLGELDNREQFRPDRPLPPHCAIWVHGTDPVSSNGPERFDKGTYGFLKEIGTPPYNIGFRVVLPVNSDS